MDGQPSYFDEGSIQEQEPGKKKLIITLAALTLVAVAGGGILLTLSGTLPNPFSKTKETEEVTEQALPSFAPRIITSQKALQKNLSNTMKTISSIVTPSGSKTATAPKYLDIQKYIDQAEKEPSLDKSYSLYVKAYTAMIAAYKETKDSKYLTAIVDLKKIVLRYPEYKEGDFPIATQ